MAKPKLFLSSTFYDLRQIRTDLDLFVENLGYDIIRNEEGDIPYGKDEALEEYCYKEIKGIDILISIIGGRYGTESKRGNNSISQLELKTALKENKQVYIFIEKNVLSEYETYMLNKDREISYRFVDDKRIYNFIEEIKSLPNNNNIKGFETASDISKYLKELTVLTEWDNVEELKESIFKTKDYIIAIIEIINLFDQKINEFKRKNQFRC